MRVLTYHTLDERASVLSTAPGVFAEQIRLRKGWGAGVIPLDLVTQTPVSAVPSEGCMALLHADP